MRRLVSGVFLLIALVAFSACSQQESERSDIATQLENGSVDHRAAPTQGQTQRGAANAFNEADSSANAAPQPALPANCAVYLAKIDACAAQLGAASEVGSQLKESAEEARRQWTQASDPAAVGEMCKQSVAQFKESAAEAGCS